ncbi:MAG: peptidoglycan-binding protein [Clostridiales bacterium]|jgi:peptidoglycan hydrolase-like protein with peptidoglycan-binding domain|nr:peptidoglycan-binding protein [Clostridiales bacterium]
MKKTFNRSLEEIGNIAAGSSTVKRAAVYKKRLHASATRARMIKIMAFNAACLVAVAISLMIVLDKQNKQSIPAYYVKEMERQNPLSAEKSATSTTQIQTEPQDPAIDNITVVEVAFERMLSASKFGDLYSDDIQPKMESDFLPVLQQRLMELHYLERDEPTTFYGTATETAVREFQAQHGLEATGVASYQTLLVMFSEKAANKVISVGQEGQYISNLQERLAQLGYDVRESGIFDEPMQSAICAFQLNNGFDATGALDQEMEEALFAEGALCADGSAYKSAVDENQTLNVSALVDIAYQQLGAKYVRGGRIPGMFDCSGLVYYCLKQSGYEIDYMTSSGWRGTRKYAFVADMDELQVGDICMFDGHVGIYIGYGKMIDASSNEGMVRISSDITRNSYWRKNWIGGRRLL